MTRGQNMQHGQTRRHPVSPAWPVLGGIVLAVLVAIPLVHVFFGSL